MAALSVQKLQKSFGGLRVTDAVDLTVEPGERRLIIGPNGAGKTTLFNLITGELAPDSGSILLFDHDITQLPSRRRAHFGMARTYQIITLFPRDTIVRNVCLALLGLSPLRWNAVVAFDRQRQLFERAHAALARVGLDHIADRPLSQTSYGEQRRVEIAMALAQNPKVLLLDEPFAGLSIDVGGGLLPSRAGAIGLSGAPVTRLAPEATAARGVALVPQGRRIFKSLTARENLAVAARTPAGGKPLWTLDSVFRLFPRLSE